MQAGTKTRLIKAGVLCAAAALLLIAGAAYLKIGFLTSGPQNSGPLKIAVDIGYQPHAMMRPGGTSGGEGRRRR